MKRPKAGRLEVMESYKHSCPVCGQHVEYTAGYCGKQMSCPMCGHSIVFPAVPPRPKDNPLRTSRPSESAVKKKPVTLTPWPFLQRLREFEHWKVVLQCLVPFILVGALLEGASLARKHSSDQPDKIAAPVTQADPGAWKKMTDLARAERAVQMQLKYLTAASADAVRAQEYYNASRNKYHEEESARAQAKLSAARQAFENAFLIYQRLGGTVDYRSQAPR